MYCGNGEHWGWQRDERCLQKHFNGANMNKEHEEWRGARLQLKRHRLQFDTQLEDSPFCDEEITPVFLKSNETKESLEEVFPQASQWDSAYQDISASSYNGLDQSSERWIADCFNDSEIHFSPNDMNLPGASDIQIDISDFCNDPPEFEANVVQKCVTRTPRNVVFKGMKSFIQTPTKLAISVAYPFAFIKPCGVHGDVTLNEINQRIRTPRDEEPVVYPMSAFSGKPVVGKTKIRTEGGKGNITIMRTKG
ncbi:protein XRI1-like isoform X4 [Populus alba x Populus x berolinensis]|nr:protein XRI1-like isoform X4 [Populus alba x Populus x berolinensis]